MKTAKAFRLSEQAVKRLQTLKEKTGTNETAIIEIALALFEGQIMHAIEDGTPAREEDGTPADAGDGNLAWEMGIQAPAVHKKRKRKRKH